VVGVRCKDGIILTAATYPQKNSLLVNSPQKVYFIDDHICIAASGLLSDSSVIVQIAQGEAIRFEETYGEPIPVENLCDYLASVLHALTMRGRHRPLAVSLMVAGWDKRLGPQIYTTDPEGSFRGWNAVAIGSNSDKLMSELEKVITSKDQTVQTIRPKFISNVMLKHLRYSGVNIGTSDIAAEPSSRNSTTAEISTDSATVETNGENLRETRQRTVNSIFDGRTSNDDEPDWVFEEYTCMKTSRGEVCWSRVVP